MSSRLALRVVMVAAIVFAGANAYGQRTGDQTEAKKALQEANSRARQGKHKQAAPIYRKAIRLDPLMVEAVEAFSRSLFVTKKYPAGQQLLRNALKRLPNNPRLKAQLGLHLFKLGRVKEAHGFLKDTFAAQPSQYAIQAVAAECCLKVGDSPCAIDALKNYLASRPKEAAAQDALVRVKLGRALLKVGRDKEAETAIRTVLRSKPKYVSAKVVMAGIQLKRGNTNGAITLYEELERRMSSKAFASSRIRLAQAYLSARRFRDAHRQAEKHLSSNPNHPEALQVKGDAAFGLRRYAEALKHYRRVLKLTGGTPQMRLRVGQVHFRRKRYATVLSTLSKDLKAKPSAEHLILAIRAAIRSGKKQPAFAFATKLMGRSAPTARQLYFAGIAHSSLGKFKEAVPLYTRALSLNKKHLGARQELIRAHCYIARRTLKSDGRAAAIAQLELAARVNPRSMAVNRNLALLELGRGGNEKALRHLRVVLTKSPTDFIANRLAGRALHALGRSDEALRYFDQAMASVVRHGGVPLARALTESAVIRMESDVDTAVVGLKRALSLVAVSGKTKALHQKIRFMLATAQIRRAVNLHTKGKTAAAFKLLREVRRLTKALPKPQKKRMDRVVAVIALLTGESPPKKKPNWKQLASVLAAPYRRIGADLLKGIVAAKKPGAASKLTAAKAFERAKRRLPAAIRKPIERLARISRQHAAALLFATGKTRQALTLLRRTYGRKGARSSKEKHNLAVLEFNTGQKKAGLVGLRAVRKQIPLSLCNLAVHFDRAGDYAKSSKLFFECQRAGGARYFPELDTLVKARRRVLGDL